jgi:hypothetical protein
MAPGPDDREEREIAEKDVDSRPHAGGGETVDEVQVPFEGH